MREEIARLAGIATASAIALGSLACDDAGTDVPGAGAGTGGSTVTMGGSSPGGASGAAGVGGSATPPGTALSWTAEGFVAKDSNPFQIEGPFYAYSDCEPPSGLPCTAPDTTITGADGKPGWSVDGTRACIKGTAVQVKEMMFAAQWGAGLALDLASPGGEPGAPAMKNAFDLTKAKIRGFSVDIAGNAPARIRINLTMNGVADSSFVDALVPGTTTFAVTDVKQGSWVATKTPLDPTRVEALQFQVFTGAGSSTPYDFCVTAIRVITEDAAGAP
ncbi:MAG: hypothetical protein K0R38_6112 [Polyangiaceae bacterium]|jgi:hypothetical protein|nr:hypothetical protein [Polyangiaceae bacterium]